MSLLLDALHRASKDKERAAAAGNAGPPTLKIKDAVAPKEDFPLLQEASSIRAATGNVEQAPYPPNELSLEAPNAMRVKAEVPTPAQPSAAVTAPEWEMAQAIDEVPAATQPVTPVPVSVSAPSAPLPLDPSQPTIRLTIDPVVEAPPTTSKVAQEIRRAYMPDRSDTPGTPANNRRAVVLGGVALVLAIVLGSVMLGVWGDPMRWIGAGPSQSEQSVTPAAPWTEAAPAAVVPLASASAPTVVAPAAVPSSVVPMVPKTIARTFATPAAPTTVAVPAIKPAKPPGGDKDVSLRNEPDRQSIVSRTRGASTLEIGYAALLDGKLDEAAQAYAQALGDNPEERDALLGLAYVAHKKGQRESAQDLYRRVLRQDPNNIVASAGLIALDTNADNALTSSRARELAQQQPDSAAAVALAAGVMARDGQVADAAQLFARAQQLEPGNAMHAYNYAVALDRLGQHPAARVQYEKAMQLANRGSNANTRTFSLDTVRLRLNQLSQGGLVRPEAVK